VTRLIPATPAMQPRPLTGFRFMLGANSIRFMMIASTVGTETTVLIIEVSWETSVDFSPASSSTFRTVCSQRSAASSTQRAATWLNGGGSKKVSSGIAK
jgi:hypothetical protein